jgi:hypothetical protein
MEIPSYVPQAVAQALIDISGVSLSHAAVPSWWEWRARWEGATGRIEFAMTLFEPADHEPTFGGFGLVADCDPKDLLALWEALRARFGGIWLHSPDCEILKPLTFARRYAA